MSDKQRHLVIILSILFIAIVCSAIVLVARNVLQRTEETVEDQFSIFSEAVQGAEGVQISAVAPNSPAARAGVPVGTTLLGVDGHPISNPQDVVDYMNGYAGDGNVVLTLRETEAITTKTLQLAQEERVLGLELLPQGERLPSTPTPEVEETAVSPLPTLPATPLIAPPLITSIQEGSAAANAGLQVGDIITLFDDESILNNAELIAAVASKAPGTAVRLTLRRGENTLVVTIPLGSHPEDPTRGFLGVELQEQ